MIARAPALALPLLLGGCVLNEPAPAPPTQPAFYASLASPGARADSTSARDIINGYRANLGLAPLAVDARLTAFAQHEAEAMARSGSVDATRNAPLTDRLKAAGIAAGKALENASGGYYTVSDAFSGWRGSPRHDATLRLPAGRRMGIAASYNAASKYKVYWTLVVTD